MFLLLGSLLGGSYVLEFFGITLPIVRVAGGLLVAATGWNLLKAGDEDNARDDHRPVVPTDAFYPLTMPITVGPGSIAVAITLGSERPRGADLTYVALLGGAAIAGLIAIAATIYVCYRFADSTVRVLGDEGTNVLVRLSAFILLCIGIAIIWDGYSELVTSQASPGTRNLHVESAISHHPLVWLKLPTGIGGTCMSLHRKHEVGIKASDVMYASGDLSLSVPKYKIPREERSPRIAYALVHDELLLDGNSRQNLATFCTTWNESEVQALMAECVDKNICDKDEYPQSAEIENRCVHILADLWNSPDGANTIGCSTTGSSEAAMLSGLAAKWRWRTRMRAQGKSVEKPNLVCGAVQVCWHKFGRYFDVEVREVPVEGDRLTMGPNEVLARCDENTIMVVPTLGLTMSCQYEPVQAIAQALDTLEQRHRTGYSDACGCRQRRFSRSVLPARYCVGFPLAKGQIDQLVGPQIWPRSPRCRLGDMARPCGSAR